MMMDSTQAIPTQSPSLLLHVMLLGETDSALGGGENIKKRSVAILVLP